MWNIYGEALFLRKSSVGFNPGGNKENILGVGRVESSKPNPSEVS